MTPKPKPTNDESSYLESHGWVKIKPDYDPRWCWRQMKTGALFTLKDACDCQHGLDQEKGIKRDAGRRTAT